MKTTISKTMTSKKTLTKKIDHVSTYRSDVKKHSESIILIRRTG